MIEAFCGSARPLSISRMPILPHLVSTPIQQKAEVLNCLASAFLGLDENLKLDLDQKKASVSSILLTSSVPQCVETNEPPGEPHNFQV